MHTLKQLSVYVFFVCFFGCKSAKNDFTDLTANENCIVLYDKDGFNSISNFYNKDLRKQYNEFLESNFDIDAILVYTKYGYSISQEYFRLYMIDGRTFVSSINFERKELSTSKGGNEFLNQHKLITHKSVFINCPENSSMLVKVEFLLKTKNALTFSFRSNKKIQEINSDISQNELFLIKTYLDYFK